MVRASSRCDEGRGARAGPGRRRRKHRRLTRGRTVGGGRAACAGRSRRPEAAACGQVVDGVHPGDEGHALLARAVAENLTGNKFLDTIFGKALD